MRNYCITKGILTLLLLIFVQPLVALECPYAFQNGFYVKGALGAGLGHAGWGGVSSVTAINDQGTPLMISESWNPDGRTSVTRTIGQAALGSQFLQQPFYLAAEISGTFSGAYYFDLNENKAFSLATNYLGSIKTLNASTTLHDAVILGGSEFDFDIKPGWLFEQNFLGHARIGLAVNKLSIENAGTWTNISSSPPFFQNVIQISAQGFSMKKNTVCGIRLGLGGEYLITQNLGIALDYIYTDYGRITTTAESFASTAPFIPPTSPYYAIKGIDAPIVNISTQAVMLGLLYHC